MNVVPQPAQPTILVVDDDAGIATLLYEFLTGEGFRVLVEHTGGDALASVVRNPPTLVLCDWMMPGMDGPHLIAAMRRWRGRIATIPVVLMSSAHVAGEAMPDVPFLAKPFSLDAVLNLVTTLTRPSLPAALLGHSLPPTVEHHDQ